MYYYYYWVIFEHSHLVHISQLIIRAITALTDEINLSFFISIFYLYEAGLLWSEKLRPCPVFSDIFGTMHGVIEEYLGYNALPVSCVPRKYIILYLLKFFPCKNVISIYNRAQARSNFNIKAFHIQFKIFHVLCVS